MKKIVLHETQVDKLMGKIVSEQYRDNERFHIECECDIDYHGLTYKGFEIDYIGKTTVTVSYRVDAEYRSYGMKSVSVYAFEGPSEIELVVYYYPNESYDPEEAIVTLPLDWENNLNTYKDEDMGYFGVSNDMTIELTNSPDGDFMVKEITINYNDL